MRLFIKRKNVCFWVIIIFNILIHQTIFAQLPYIQPVNFPFQLPTKVIYDIFSDKYGQIWLGTDKGLYRFNGKNATLIPFKKAAQTEITHLKTDKQGKIWGMNFTKEIFFLQNDTLHLFEPPKEIKLKGALWHFDIDTENNLIWLQSSQTIVAYHLQTKKKAFHYENLKFHFFYLKYHEGNVYVTCAHQKFLLKIHHQKGITKIPCKERNEDRFFIFQNKLHSLERKKTNRNPIVIENDKVIDLDIPKIDEQIFIYHCDVTNDKEIWICTSEGLLLWDIQTGKTNLILKDKQVTGVIQDFQGNHWFSTQNDGLWFCPSIHTLSFQPQNIDENSLNITKITEDKEKFWIGDYSGNIYTTEKNSLNQWQNFGKSHSDIRQFLINDNKESMYLLAGGNIFNKKGENTKKITPIKDATFIYDKKTNKQYTLLAHSGGAFIIQFDASLKEIQEFHQKNSTLFNFPKDTIISINNFGVPAYQIRGQRATAVAINQKKELFWVAFEDGLYEFDFLGNHKIIKTQTGEKIIAKVLFVDNKNRLWAGTFNAGLYIIENQKVIKKFNKENILESNHIRRIYPLKNQVWIGTDNQIGILDVDNNTFADILAKVGLNIAAISYKDFIPFEQGIYIALTHKLLFIPKNDIQKTYKINLLPIVFSGRKMKKNQNNVFIFDKIPSEVTFKVEALHYKNTSQVQILCRLKEIDTTWQTYNDVTALIKYNHLNYGTYTFEVFAKDLISGVKSDIKTIIFKIPPHFTQKIEFQLLVVAILTTIIYFALNIWLVRFRHKQTLKEQLLASQLQTLQMQMNPHFLYNVLNSVQGLVYGNRKLEAAELLGNFSFLMRQMLQNSSNRYISLEKEIENLKLYIKLEKARFDETLQVNFECIDLESLGEYQIPSMLVQPLIENAFRHGLLHKKGDKKLNLIFQKKENYLQIIVDDNGIGREKAKEIQKRQVTTSTGFALNATKQRIKLLNEMDNKNIQLEFIDKKNIDNQSEGTKVILYLNL